MPKYWVYKRGRLIGGIEIAKKTADRIRRSKIFRLVQTH